MRELQQSDIPVVRKSVPVLYFGNLQRYLSSPLRVITVALNPSLNEFPEKQWDLRFPGAREASQKAHFSALNQYFEHEPLWEKWFTNLDWLLEGMDSGFRAGRSSFALHTDLCTPIATNPTYSGLTPKQKCELEKLGLPLWYALAALLDPDVIVMSGGPSLRDRVATFEGAKWLRIFGEGKKAVDVAEINSWGRRRLVAFGWTVNVPFGALKSEERRVAGGLIARAVESRNICRGRTTTKRGKSSMSSTLIRTPTEENMHSISAVNQERQTEIVIPNAASSTEQIQPARDGIPAIASYKFSRLCFRRTAIESIGLTETFRVITPIGTFQMSKADFYKDFGNVVASKSYRENGIYHYPKVPARAEKYRVFRS
jgi:hypothetical protein